MKTVTQDHANRLIGRANAKGHEVVIYFDGEERRYEAGQAKTLPKTSEPGTYVVKIFCPPKKDEEKGTVDEYVITIDPPEEVEPVAEPAPAIVAAPINAATDSVSIIMQMRQMDLQAWERERVAMRSEINQLREHHAKMLEAEREKHQAALKQAEDSYNFRLALLQGNQSKLDEERSSIRENEYKLAKLELQRKMKTGDDDGMSLKDLMTIVAPLLMRGAAAPQTQQTKTPREWNEG